MRRLMMTIFASFTMLTASTQVSSQTQPDVTITYLQNDGVLISNGTDKVLIDAIFSQASGWINLSTTEANKLVNAQAPYDDVDLILITHNHSDHYGVSAVRTHLNNNAIAKLIAPPPVAANFSSTRVVNVNPARGESDTLNVNGIEVEVLHLRHFDAFGMDFSTVQNFGFLVKISGTQILHLGDVDMTVANFQNFGLAERAIDVVLIPTFNTPAHLTTSHREALNSQIQPAHIIGLHLLSGSIASIRQEVETLYPGATIFTTPLQTFTLNVTSVTDQVEVPTGFRLEQNYPNPFNPTTSIEFSLSRATTVSLKVYDILGKAIRTLADGAQPRGAHKMIWDGRDESGQPVTSGVYLYKIDAQGFVQVKKMLLVK